MMKNFLARINFSTGRIIQAVEVRYTQGVKGMTNFRYRFEKQIMEMLGCEIL